MDEEGKEGEVVSATAAKENAREGDDKDDEAERDGTLCCCFPCALDVSTTMELAPSRQPLFSRTRPAHMLRHSV